MKITFVQNDEEKLESDKVVVWRDWRDHDE